MPSARNAALGGVTVRSRPGVPPRGVTDGRFYPADAQEIVAARPLPLGKLQAHEG